MPRNKVQEFLKVEDFQYVKENELPKLILGIHIRQNSLGSEYPPRAYNFKKGLIFEKMVFQTAGHACHSHYIVGTFLKPKPEIVDSLKKLTEKWLNSDAGCFGVSLDELIQYRKDLKNLLGVDCNNSYQHFEEAIYPIDIEFLQKLSTDKLPKNLDDLIEFESGFERACGCIGRWGIYLIGPNGD